MRDEQEFIWTCEFQVSIWYPSVSHAKKAVEYRRLDLGKSELEIHIWEFSTYGVQNYKLGLHHYMCGCRQKGGKTKAASILRQENKKPANKPEKGLLVR